MDDYARRLSGDQSPDGAKRHVDAVLRASYEMLVPGLRKLWRTLAVFPDTFEVNAAAAVWKIHPARAANALDRLMAYSLIERNRASGRFRLHDLMMLFAESCLTEKERAIARHHHAAHYQSVLHEADALYELMHDELVNLTLIMTRDLQDKRRQATRVLVRALEDLKLNPRHTITLREWNLVRDHGGEVTMFCAHDPHDYARVSQQLAQ